MVPDVYRRFDDWELGQSAGTVPPVCPAFFHPGSWIGTDRDGNPNVTARVSRAVAEKFRGHVLRRLAEATQTCGRNLTLDAASTPPSDALVNLWSHQVEMSEELTSRALGISASEPHRAAMLVIAERLRATVARTADVMYASADDYIADLRVVQDSLARTGAVRAAYGPVQRLIWQAQTFGFHLVEMEFRQHSLVHARALERHSRARPLGRARRARAHDARGARHLPRDLADPAAQRRGRGAALHHLVHALGRGRGQRLRARAPGLCARGRRARAGRHPAL